MLVAVQDLRADPVVQVAEDGVILVPLLGALLHKVLRAAQLDTDQQAALVLQSINPAVVVVLAKQAIPTRWDSAATVDLTRYQALRLFMQVEAVAVAADILEAMGEVALAQQATPMEHRALSIPVAVAVVVIKIMLVQELVAQAAPA